MAEVATHSEDELAGVAFVGNVLAPFFLQDPRKGEAGASYAAIAELDAQAAGAEWPFADPARATEALVMMQEGLADGGPEGDPVTWEYRRLFIGPAPKPCPPWGSVYTDHEMVVFGETTLELRAWMRKHKVWRESDERTPEDHIGLMLALMAFLAENRPEILDEYLRDHLLTWSDHYLEQLQEDAEQPFFEGLARLTRASLDGIQEAFGIQVEYPRFYR